MASPGGVETRAATRIHPQAQATRVCVSAHLREGDLGWLWVGEASRRRCSEHTRAGGVSCQWSGRHVVAHTRNSLGPAASPPQAGWSPRHALPHGVQPGGLLHQAAPHDVLRMLQQVDLAPPLGAPPKHAQQQLGAVPSRAAERRHVPHTKPGAPHDGCHSTAPLLSHPDGQTCKGFRRGLRFPRRWPRLKHSSRPPAPRMDSDTATPASDAPREGGQHSRACSLPPRVAPRTHTLPHPSCRPQRRVVPAAAATPGLRGRCARHTWRPGWRR